MKVTTLSILALVIALASTPALAHVHLDSPNGGEVLVPGQVVVIAWHPTVGHATLGWDLEYSLNGSSGPWQPIAFGLPPGDISTGAMHLHYWVVPATDTSTLRVRVRQVNNGTDYTDISDADLSIRSSLSADLSALSIANGGNQVLALDMEMSLANETYIVLGNFSGTAPGIPYQGFLIPLNQDYYFDQTLNFPNTSPFSNSLGSLAGDGSAQVVFQLAPGVLSPNVAGVVLHHAAVVVDANGQLLHVSNPVSLTLQP